MTTTEPFLTMYTCWESPPLRSNDKLHWAKKAALVKEIRHSGAWEARHIDEKFSVPVMITLVWNVPDNRIRDVGACAPTLKAWIDGMVDAGMLLGDDHRYVTRESYEIRVTPGHRAVVVEVEPDLRGVA